MCYLFFILKTGFIQQDEVFVSAEDASHQFETQRRHSSLLPEASVFDTLTDSILGGELDVSLLADKDVGKQIRRGKLVKLDFFLFS